MSFQQSILLTILCFLTVWLSSCDNSTKQFAEAESINTIVSYTDFIDDYPESEYTKLACSRRDSLEFLKIEEIKSEEAYFNYAKDHPLSKFSKISLSNAASIAYNAAIYANTEEQLLQFAEKYPSCENVTEALEIAALLRYNEAVEDQSIKGFQELITKYPDSHYAVSASTKIDDIRNGRQFWDKEEFIEKIKKLKRKDFSQLYKYKFTLIDGGNMHEFIPDKRNGTIPLLDLEIPGLESVTVSDFIKILYYESFIPAGDKGIGEIFFWNRSLLVYFTDENFPDESKKALYNKHIVRSQKHKEIQDKLPYSTLCTLIDY